MKTTKALLIKLPISLVEQLDEAAAVLNLTRVGVIRRSLKRDLPRVCTEHYLPLAVEDIDA